MKQNAFFKVSDPTVSEVGGMELLPSWWSRMYEYAWARQFAEPGMLVADMGAGWSGRPFKEELASICEHVYAVDKDERFLDLPKYWSGHLSFIVANFEEEVPLPPALDVVFCISVLEDLTDYTKALKEFYRLLKPGGLLVITCDSRYDDSKPLPKYPGVSFNKLFDAIQEAGFSLPDDMDFDLTDAVHNEEWNLACWHMVLKKDEVVLGAILTEAVESGTTIIVDDVFYAEQREIPEKEIALLDTYVRYKEMLEQFHVPQNAPDWFSEFENQLDYARKTGQLQVLKDCWSVK